MRVTLTNSVSDEAVEFEIPDSALLGCEHGRRVGQPCPHCLGLNGIKQLTKQELMRIAEPLIEYCREVEHEEWCPEDGFEPCECSAGKILTAVQLVITMALKACNEPMERP
jgi:hypothetical protein